MSSTAQPNTRTLWIALAVIIGAGLVLRLCHLSSPATDFPADRQITTALLAEAWGGGRAVSDYHFSHPVRDDARVLMPEAPILPALAGLTGRVCGLSPAATFTAARVWTILFSLGSIVLLFAIGRRWIGPGAGLWSAALFAFLPASVYLGRAVTPDVPMTTFSLLAVWATDRWIGQRRPLWAIIAGVALFLAIAAKLYGGVIMLAVVCLLIESRQAVPRLARRWAVGGAVAIVVVAVFACYPLSPLSLSEDLAAMSVSTNSLLDDLPASLTSLPHWVAFANRIDLTLTVGVALLTVAGIGVALAGGGPVALLVWLAAQAAFTFVATGANTYWAYALLAPATLCAGATLSTGIEWAWRRGFSPTRRLFACGAIALLPVFCVLLSRSPGKIARSYYRTGERLAQAGDFVASQTRPNATLAAAGETPFDLLWLSGRKGWSLRSDEGDLLAKTKCDTLAVFRPSLSNSVFAQAFAEFPIVATSRDAAIFHKWSGETRAPNANDGVQKMPQPIVFEDGTRLEGAGAVVLSKRKPTTVAITLVWSTPQEAEAPYCVGIQWRRFDPNGAKVADDVLRMPALSQAVNLEGESFTRAQFSAVEREGEFNSQTAQVTRCTLAVPEHFPPGMWRMGVSLWRGADKPLAISSPAGGGELAWLNVISIAAREVSPDDEIDPADTFFAESVDGRLSLDGTAITDRPLNHLYLDLGTAETTRVVTLTVQPRVRMDEFCALTAMCGERGIAPLYSARDNGSQIEARLLSPPGATGATVALTVSITSQSPPGAPTAFPLYPGEVHTKPSNLRLLGVTTRTP